MDGTACAVDPLSIIMTRMMAAAATEWGATGWLSRFKSEVQDSRSSPSPADSAAAAAMSHLGFSARDSEVQPLASPVLRLPAAQTVATEPRGQ